TTGPVTTTPTMVSSAPRPARASTPLLSPITAASTTATPMPVTPTPATTRAPDARVRSTATSRNAANGRTRDAFTAGPIPATRVTSTPTTSDTTAVVPVKTRPPAGSAKPKASNIPLSSPAMARPPNTPTTDATAPTSAASTTTDTRT